MLNQIILVGRLTDTQTTNQTTTITLAVSRSYKNTNGEYETDFIPVEIPHTIAQSTLDYLHKGDVIGVKGRIQTTDTQAIKIIADRITFLSSNPNPNPTTETPNTNPNPLNEGEI